MSSSIAKLKLTNYKRFKQFEFIPKERTNIIVGDNEAGKSTILEAIDLVISGNIRKVESIGIDRIINCKNFIIKRLYRLAEDIEIGAIQKVKIVIKMYVFY